MLPRDVDRGSQVSALIGESLRELSRKACLQPEAGHCLGLLESHRCGVVTVGAGSSFGVRLEHRRQCDG